MQGWKAERIRILKIRTKVRLEVRNGSIVRKVLEGCLL